MVKANVVELKRLNEPALAFAEVRLSDECDLELTVYDEVGNVVIIEFNRITELSQAFQERLLQTWATKWKADSSVAS